MDKTLSIIIPAYNEALTIHVILDKILKVNLLHGINKEGCIAQVRTFVTPVARTAVGEIRRVNPLTIVPLQSAQKCIGARQQLVVLAVLIDLAETHDRQTGLVVAVS